jgi:hypothetical protein
MSSWRTIDTAPRQGETILVANHREAGVAFWRHERWNLGGLMYFDRPTHWMPLVLPLPSQSTSPTPKGQDTQKDPTP